MSFSTWLLFLTISLAAAFSPGPGVLMAISTATTLGPGRALYSSAGNALGVFAIAGLTVTGLGLLLQTSLLAFTVLKLAGAAYLVYLGVRAWRQAADAPALASPAAAPAAAGAMRTFQRGLLVALSNPKAILFFTAVFPQFMTMDHIDPLRFLVLTTTFACCTLLSHGVYVLCTQWLQGGLRHASQRRLANRATGALFVGMGAMLLKLSHHGS